MDIKIIGMRVDPTSYEAATAQVLAWAREKESRYVCIANVNNIMEAFDSPEYRQIINRADLITPDGMPLVWTLRRLGFPRQERVYGPDLTLKLVETAAEKGVPVGFYGSTSDVLERMILAFKDHFPALQVSYSFSPPFHDLSQEEDKNIVDGINSSGVRILFVGLGCPKQERWMAEHRGKIQAVMLGVGAAFDFHAGMKPQAPLWMRENGLEWLYRLSQEPGRLWRRYLYHNPRFIVLVAIQLLFRKK